MLHMAEWVPQKAQQMSKFQDLTMAKNGVRRTLQWLPWYAWKKLWAVCPGYLSRHVSQLLGIWGWSLVVVCSACLASHKDGRKGVRFVRASWTPDACHSMSFQTWGCNRFMHSRMWAVLSPRKLASEGINYTLQLFLHNLAQVPIQKVNGPDWHLQTRRKLSEPPFPLLPACPNLEAWAKALTS